MRAKEIIMEGGWADTRTQSASPITPAVVKKAVIVIQNFIKKFNKFVKTKGLPPVGGGRPVGSSYYYQKDLVDDPTKEYGDIDIQFLLPRFPNKSDAQVQELYVELVEAYTKVDSNISTNGGKNVSSFQGGCTRCRTGASRYCTFWVRKPDSSKMSIILIGIVGR